MMFQVAGGKLKKKVRKWFRKWQKWIGKPNIKHLDEKLKLVCKINKKLK
jgi:hypothetical protein